jgi:hypothetical protein
VQHALKSEMTSSDTTFVPSFIEIYSSVEVLVRILSARQPVNFLYETGLSGFCSCINTFPYNLNGATCNGNT